MRLKSLLPLLCLLGACSPNLSVDNLTTEYLTDPLGIDAREPRLSWQISARGREIVQTAYEIEVWRGDAQTPAAEQMAWQSGPVESSRSLHILYGGEPLRSGELYRWRVRIRDNRGHTSAWSRPALFRMGLLEPTGWTARWIGLDQPYTEPDDDHRLLPARMLRREFSLEKPVRRATLFLSGLGFSELYLNGQKVDDRIMDPTPTNYDRRVLYVTHDVTAQLREGANALGVWLGNGRFFAPRLRTPIFTPNFGFPKMLLQLEILYADGSTERIVSDEQWMVTDHGPIRANSEFDGEEYDARMEQPLWATPGFDLSEQWQPAQLTDAPKGVLTAQMQEPMRVVETIAPVSIRRSDNGAWLVDFGQNLYGMCRIHVSGPRGTRITIRTTFDLDSTGRNIDMSNNRSARSTDVYTLRGDGSVESWAPRFRGQGFRYAEVSGWPGELSKKEIEMLVVHSDLKPAGRFACSDTLVNRIYANMLRSVRMQERGLPLDPDRDERQAWLSVSEMTSETEGYMYNVAAFYENFLAETRADQHANGCISDAGSMWSDWGCTGDPCWPSVITTNPWSQYRMYGDARQLELCYPVMKRWVEFLGTRVDDDLIYRKGVYSDWVDAYTMDIYDEPPFGGTPRELLSTAYYYYNLKTVERTAIFLNRPDEALPFGLQAARVKEAFNDAFFDPATGEYLGNTQAGYALAFEFGLVPEGRREQVAQRFADNVLIEHDGHLSVGCPGVKWLMQALTRIGRTDIAWTILTRTTRPGWGYMVQAGGTSIWERWDCNTQEPGMNGQSQTILAGYLGAWMYRTLAGIAYDPADPGFRHIIMRPEPVGDLRWVDASYESLYGEIVSSWKIDGDTFRWTVSVPPNCRATLHIPARAANAVLESTRESYGVKFVAYESGRAILRVGSGNYTFTSKVR